MRTPATILLGLTLLAGCDPPPAGAATSGGPDARADDRPPLVRTAAVELREVRREIATTGFLEAEHRVEVFPEVGGKVLDVNVDDGSEIRAGQVLARLDSRAPEAALAQVRTQLDAARVRLALAELSIESAVTRIAQARIDRDKAQAEYERQSSLDEELVSPKVLQESLFAAQSAEEALKVAGYDRRQAELDVESARTSVAELEARIEELTVRLEDHEVRSPLDGVVITCAIRGGETITPSTRLFEVVDPRRLVAYFSRPQRELSMVSQAREVLFTADAYPGREFTADVDLVSPVVDRETGAFRIRVRIRREDTELLRAGMWVRARILTEATREALMVPKTAVLAEGSDSVVFAVRNGRAEKITVETGIEEREHVECLNLGDDGLGPEDLVVVTGNEDLRDKQSVEVARDG